MTKVKHKYKVGEIVYCRPFIVSGNGMKVYKCEVSEAEGTVGGKNPYYTLKIIKEDEERQLHISVRYENEISKVPHRLVREARKEIDKKYKRYIESYENYINELNKLK